jgi:hypothetical protein
VKSARNKFPRGERDGRRQIKALTSRIRFFWDVERGGGWGVERALGIPPRAGPVLESKLRRMHEIGDQCDVFFVQGEG